MNCYVFFHVGEDSWQPEILTRSILVADPSAEIIQVSTPATTTIRGVSRHIEFECSGLGLMSYRLDAFSKLDLEYPAIYLDTDMILLEPVNPLSCLNDKDVAMCRRVFQRDYLFNTEMRGMKFPEYSGMTMDEVYPYLACATVTSSSREWTRLSELLKQKAPKFQTWYGDQEALKLYQSLHHDNVSHILEDVYACLPEKININHPPKIIHFKGPSRKAHMKAYAQKLMSLS